MKKNIMDIDRATEPYTYIYVSSLKKLGNEIENLNHKVESLQEQLKEANELLNLYLPKKRINSVCVKPINNYKTKWGVK